MNLFELYKIINENLQQKSNLLATVLEGEAAGTRYFWADGELLGYTGTGEVNEELKTQITETPQSGIYEIEGQKFFIEHLKRQAHLVICGGGHVSQQVISRTITEKGTIKMSPLKVEMMYQLIAKPYPASDIQI